MEEICVAVVIEDGDNKPRDKEDINNIIDCCMSFVTHDPFTGYVRFIHLSVQRWFDSEPQQQKLLKHNYLAKTCLTYLKLFAAPNESIVQYLPNFPFYRYAAKSGDEHTRKAEHDTDVQKAALAFLEADDSRRLMLQISGRDTRMPVLHIAAANGLAAIFQMLLDVNM